MKKILVMAILTGIMLFLAGCVVVENLPGKNVVPLGTVEVKDYKGEKLGSINDFRENSIKGPQYVNISEYKLMVGGLVENPRSYTYDEVLMHQHYSKVVTLLCVEGWSVTVLWEGVLLKDLLKEAKLSPGANTVVFYAYDGYSSSLPLDYIENNDIMMAYKMNNITIPPERGFPFQLVAEEKWGYKWVKWIKMIEVTNDPNYQGYWEKRGYSNSGDINESFYS